MYKRIILLLIVSFFGLQSYGQFCYDEYTTKDNVKISYKWKDVKDGPKELRFKLKNRNKYPVMVNLEVDYYMSGILQESSVLEDFCLNKKQLVAGKMNGVIFTTTELSNEDLESEDFKLEINNISIEKTERCPEKDEE